MDWKLEVVVLPVTDVDRAKRFYEEQCGFHVDVDRDMGSMRIVQLTPPGSACSVTIGPVVLDDAPATPARLQIVVPDVAAARADLAARGVDVGPVVHPDGNNWAIQQAPTAA